VNLARLTLLSLACIPLACGDDDAGGSADGTSGGSTTSDDSTSSTSTSTTSADETTVASASASGDESSSSSGGLPTEVLLGGEAQDFLSSGAIAGAEISLFGIAGSETVSDAEGLFTVGPLEPDTPVAFVIEPSEGDGETPAYAGAIVPERAGIMDRDDAVISQVQQAVIDSQLGQLEGTEAEVPDLGRAILIVILDPFAGGTSLDDGGITVTLDPPPVTNTYYAGDASGTLVLNSSTIAFNIVPAAVFYNLDDTGIGDISLTIAHEQPDLWNCSANYPEFPTFGGYITLVRLSCSAA
jgi:hypothetical protein